MTSTKGSVFLKKMGGSPHIMREKKGKISIPKVFCHRSPGSVYFIFKQDGWMTG